MNTLNLECSANTNGFLPKVSVIIPIYNVEKYLRKCIESVANQTLKEIEIICVNDGSQDNSLKILNELVQIHNNIKIINQQNSGYGKAVNAGFNIACGQYIGIVESDDFISDDMFEVLYNLSGNGSVDVIKGNFWDYYEEEGKKPVSLVNKERANTITMKCPFTLKENPEISWGHPSVWSAIYRRDFLLQNGIKMMEEKGGGWVDNPFFYETLCRAKSIIWTPKPLYYYRKTNLTSSSNSQTDPAVPFDRMNDNLNILKNTEMNSLHIEKVAYARALMYMRGAKFECDYITNARKIDQRSQELMRRLDRDMFFSQFNLLDQKDWVTNASPVKTLYYSFSKILIYNWLPFDNPWGWGGGVTVYCKNLIEQILKDDPNVSVYFLSSGFAYDATKATTYIRMIGNSFGDRVRQYEVVNSPVPAEQRMVYRNPLVALENKDLKKLIRNFIKANGPFQAIHFNNIEGLSLDIMDLKVDFPETAFLYSIHNYIAMCANGFYYMRHKHCNCYPEHSADDCYDCLHKDIYSNIAEVIYKRGLYGQDLKKCISQMEWLEKLGLQHIDNNASPEEIIKFSQTATEKINKNCDRVFAVSNRVYEIAASNGFDKRKMIVQYIGTNVANRQIGHRTSDNKDGLKIIFLGNDINYAEKGYPFLLNALKQMPLQYARKIDLVFTVKQDAGKKIKETLNAFRSVKVIRGYSHDDFPMLFDNCDLSLVPVLWEDNLPQIAIESVAYGVPVLSSTAGGASELSANKLFTFSAGDAEDLNNKIIHFLENPNDLDSYWKYHDGLVTMKKHWDELRGYYGISTPDQVVFSKEDFAYLMEERDFLIRSFDYHYANHSREMSIVQKGIRYLKQFGVKKTVGRVVETIIK